MGRNSSSRETFWAIAASAGALLLLPLALRDPFLLDVLTTGFLLSAFAGSWDVVGGMAGQLSLCHAIFFGAATYACAVLTTLLGWPILPAAAAGVLLAALAGAAVGALAAPLRGPFVAVLTLALGEAVHELVLGNVFPTGPSGYAWGGEGGIPVAVSRSAASPVTEYYAAFLLLAGAVGVMLLVRRSRQGLIFRALSESELTARASGVDVRKQKRRAFTIAAALAGAAGSAYAAHVGRATAFDFSLELSFQAATFAAVGGRGSVLGPVFAAFLLHVLFQGFDVPPGTRLLFYALALMAILRFFPGGIAGGVRRLRDFLSTPAAERVPGSPGGGEAR